MVLFIVGASKASRLSNWLGNSRIVRLQWLLASDLLEVMDATHDFNDKRWPNNEKSRRAKRSPFRIAVLCIVFAALAWHTSGVPTLTQLLATFGKDSSIYTLCSSHGEKGIYTVDLDNTVEECITFNQGRVYHVGSKGK